MTRPHIFIAIQVSDDIRKQIRSLQKRIASSLPNFRWTPPVQLHITLLFLGEIGDMLLKKTESIVVAIASKQKSFYLNVSSLSCFSERTPSPILWVGIRDEARVLHSLHDELKHLLYQVGFSRSYLPYSPHITLGKITNHDLNNDELSALLSSQKDWYGGEMKIDEIGLMSSELTKTGAVYRTLTRAKLLCS